MRTFLLIQNLKNFFRWTQIETEFKKKMEKYNKNDIFCEDLLEKMQIRRDKQLEAITAFEKKKKRELELILTTKNQFYQRPNCRFNKFEKK